MDEQKIVDIGFRLILRVVLVALALWLVYYLRGVVLLVAASALTAMALDPLVRRLQKKGLSRTVAVIMLYAVLICVGVGAIALFVPLLFTELQSFAREWPTYSLRLYTALSVVQNYFAQFGIVFDQQTLEQGFALSVDGNWLHWFSYTREIFNAFVHFIGYIFLALYLSLNTKGLDQLALIMAPEKYHEQALQIVKKIRLKVSQWLYGQLILMLIAFVMYYIGLTLLGVPYALAIALFGALMEMLPYIGPILAGIPAVFIGLLVSPVVGFSALVFYTVAHQVEAHVLAPQVMKRSAELNPVAFILAVLIGYELAGPLGIILSVPAAMILSVFVEDLLEQKHKRHEV
jgi:predicted PurR-regulated permease PerM